MSFSIGYNKLKSKAAQMAESMQASLRLPQKTEASLPYAYPCDNYIDSLLSNGLVRSTLRLLADKYCKEQVQNIKSTGVLASKENYPRFYDILQNCYKSLNVEEVPDVYITNRLKGINALSVGTDGTPVILVSRKAVVSLPDGELMFMIGHELGHILQKNLICHTVKGLLDNLNDKSEFFGPLVSDLIDVPLNQWYRCTEYTADRAGYLCCKDIEVVKSLFHRLFEQKSRTGYQNFMELYQNHPFIQSRIDNLCEYVHSL